MMRPISPITQMTMRQAASVKPSVASAWLSAALVMERAIMLRGDHMVSSSTTSDATCGQEGAGGRGNGGGGGKEEASAARRSDDTR